MFRRKLQEKLEKFAALLKECLDAQRETGKRLDGLEERLRRLEAGEKKLAKAIENKPDSKKVDADLDKRLGAFHKRICELEVSRAGFDQANVEARTAVEAINDLNERLKHLETSDFAKNREDYLRTMDALVESNPRTGLWPE